MVSFKFLSNFLNTMTLKKSRSYSYLKASGVPLFEKFEEPTPLHEFRSLPLQMPVSYKHLKIYIEIYFCAVFNFASCCFPDIIIVVVVCKPEIWFNLIQVS